MAGRFSVEAVFKAIDRMSAPIAMMQKRMLKFTKSIEKDLGNLNKIGGSFVGGVNKAGAAMLVFGAASAAALAAAAKPGMEFEQQMADLGASFLKTRGEIGALEKEAMKLGAATKFSATEVAGAMEAMSKAGFDEEQTLKGIAGMTYAAAAAGEDLIETTANVASVMKGMGLAIEQSGKVADVLALASVKTASSIGSLAESLSKAGPVAKQFNIGLTDVTAMVASLQDAGIDASEAGSAVATMLTKLATPTDAMRAKMKKLGVSFEDAQGNMKKPAVVLGEFMKASKNAGGNMKQAAFFAEMLGLRGQKAGLLLKDAFASGKYAKLVEELEKAEGTAKKMADLRMNTLTGDLDVLTENVKGLGIELFSMSSGPLRDVAQAMTKWLDENKVKILQKIQDGVKWLVDNGPALLDWFRRIGTVVGVLYFVATAISACATAVELWTLALELNPIVLFATLAVAALALIVGFWPEISAFFGKIWDGFVDLAKPVYEFVKNVATTIFGPFYDIWKAAFEFVVGAATIGVGLLFAVLGTIGGWVYENVIVPIGSFFGMLWDGIASAATTAFGFLLEGMTLWYTSVVELFSPLIAVFSGIWDAISSAFMRVLGPVFEKIQWAIDKVRAIGRGTLGTDEAPGSEVGGQSLPQSQVVSPAERISQSISESNTTNSSELTIKDQTGRASFTKPPSKTAPSTIRLQPTGVF
jgi:TP901 family phage tail tape measure protein